MLILAGCGGGSGGNGAQTVRGKGFRFEAPDGWQVKSAAATNGSVDRVEVMTFRLVKPYRPELFEAATAELDRVAVRLADELHGRVAGRSTVTAAGGKARSYRIDYGSKTTEVVTFVLSGRREYQLLCRRPSDGDDAACRLLVRSFRLT